MTLSRLRHVLFVSLLLGAPALLGCKKGSSADGAAANLPIKGPWDAVTITSLNKKDPRDASPLFTMVNTGQKTVSVVFIDFYGYDAKGNQVAKKELSYNRELKGGDKDEINTSDVKEAVSWEATYHGIKFAGDDKITMDDKRAPQKKPKGK